MAKPWTHDGPSERWQQQADLIRSPHLKATLQRAVKARRDLLSSRALAHNHAPWPVLPEPVPCAIPWKIGHLPNGTPWNIDLRQHGGLVVVLGQPGSGKSMLSYRLAEAAHKGGIRTFLVDTRHAPTYPMPVSLPFLDLHEAAISTAAPQGVSRTTWLATLQWLLESCTYVHSGSVHIQDHLKQLAEDHPNQEPCYAAVAYRLERILLNAARWSPQLTHIESAAVALKRLCDGHPLFSTTAMLPWSQRLSHSHGLRLLGVPAEAARFPVHALLLAWTMTQQATGRDDRRTRGLVIADDARVLVKALQRTGQTAVDPLQQLIDTSQSTGLLLWVNVQSPAELSPSLWSDAHTIMLVGPQDGEVLHALRHRFPLTADQARWAQEQPTGHAIMQSRLLPLPAPFPLILNGPQDLPNTHTCQQQQVQAKARLLAGHASVPWSQQPQPTAAKPSPQQAVPTPKPSTLDPAHHRLLVALSHCPHALQSELGELCGIQGRQLTTVREALAQRSLLTVHRFLRYTLLELTEHGARVVGLTHQPLPGRGAYPHRWCQARLVHARKVEGHTVTIEYAVQGGAVDVMSENAGGKRQYIEIVLSVDTLPRALEKLARIDGERLVIVPDTKTAAAVQAQPLLGIAVQTIAEMVSATKSQPTSQPAPQQRSAD